MINTAKDIEGHHIERRDRDDNTNPTSAQATEPMSATFTTNYTTPMGQQISSEMSEPTRFCPIAPRPVVIEPKPSFPGFMPPGQHKASWNTHVAGTYMTNPAGIPPPSNPQTSFPAVPSTDSPLATRLAYIMTAASHVGFDSLEDILTSLYTSSFLNDTDEDIICNQQKK